MIRCEILVTGPYSDYEGSGTNRKARVYTKGDIARFPPDYAQKLKATDMVVILTPVADETSEVIEIDLEAQDTKVIPSASESAQEYAAHHQVDLAKIKGTGKDGRVILADVHGHMNAPSSASAS